ncbi:hypothetical protein DFH06DRAFT_1137433 [Mycena polygramma]|nr:hypothetical protein DFH06DRAFT_1137433 [Mycena polygramma]
MRAKGAWYRIPRKTESRNLPNRQPFRNYTPLCTVSPPSTCASVYTPAVTAWVKFEGDNPWGLGRFEHDKTTLSWSARTIVQQAVSRLPQWVPSPISFSHDQPGSFLEAMSDTRLKQTRIFLPSCSTPLHPPSALLLQHAGRAFCIHRHSQHVGHYLLYFMGSEPFTSKRSKRSADFTPRYSSSSSSSRPTTPSQRSSYTASSYRANSRSESAIPSLGIVPNMLAALAPAHQQQQPPRRLRPDDRVPRSRTPSSSRASPDPRAWGEPTAPHYVKASPKWNASFADGHDVPPSPRGRFNPTRDTRPPAPVLPAPRSKSLLSYADYEARLSHVGYEDRLPPPVQPPLPTNPRSRSRHEGEVHQPRPPLPSLRVQPSTPVRSGFDHASLRSKSPASTRASSRSPISPNSDGASLHRKNKSWWGGASRSSSPGVEVVVLKQVFHAEEKAPGLTSSPLPPAPSSSLSPRSEQEEDEDGYTGTYRKQMGWSGEWSGARGMDDVVRSLRDLRVK